MPSKIKLETYYNRLHNCYYYKPNNNYAVWCENLFKDILKERDIDNILSIFAKKFNYKVRKPDCYISKKDREYFLKYCSTCLNNLVSYLKNKNLNNILDTYEYKSVKGFIYGTLNNYNLNLSFKNAIETYKSIDFYNLNSYIYNIVNNKNNSCLVISVPTSMCYTIPFNISDYTNLDRIIWSPVVLKIRKRGEHCSSCLNNCGPKSYSNSNRFNIGE